MRTATALGILATLTLLAQNAHTDTKLLAADGAATDAFGTAVARTANRIVVGAPTGGGGSGAVYVFAKQGGVWTQEAKLVADDGQSGDRFGASVDISGNFIAAGAPGDDDFGGEAGAAYVFERTGSVWTQLQKLHGSGAEAGARAGHAVAVDGNNLLVGAPQHDVFFQDEGQVYAFRFQGATWIEDQVLQAVTRLPDDQFGFAVSLAADRCVIGAPFQDDFGFESGAAYVFRDLGASWTTEAILYASDAAADDELARAVALEGDHVLLGAPGGDDAGSDSGSAYAFQRSGTSWLEVAKLLPGGGASGDRAGSAVALSSSHALVGAALADSPSDAGAAYLYDSATWTELKTLVASDAEAGDRFATSVALDADIAVCGAPGEDTLGAGAGAAYVDEDVTPAFVVEQNPVMNSPVECDPLGIAGGCGACPQQGNDVHYATNRFGPGSVLPHSGQVVYDETDLILSGRDAPTDLTIKRRHLSRVAQPDSMFGPSWAFNYDHRFVEVGTELNVRGFGRVDAFTETAPDVWEGGHGRYAKLDLGASPPTLRLANGTELEFLVEGPSGARVGRISAIRSPNGNRIEFVYGDNQEPLAQRRLIEIVESYGRSLSLSYLDNAFPKQVTLIVDFSGRSVAYTYGAQGELVSARSPIVNGTGGLNDFPNGKLKEYTYAALPNGGPPALASVVFPNESATSGPARFTWSYEPAGLFAGFLASCSVAGESYAYAYEKLVPGPSRGLAAAVRVTATDRRATTTVMEFAATGQMLSESVQSQGLRNGAPASYDRSFLFNVDGDMLQSVAPLGTTAVHEHADPQDVPRMSQANKTHQENPADSRGGDQLVIESEIVYEPVFNKVFQSIDPRGFEAGNDPADFTTTYVFDYMEDLTGAAAAFAPRLCMSENELLQLFADAGIVDLAGDVNGDGLTDQFCGNVIQVLHPTVTLPPQAARLGLGPTQSAEEIFRFNQFGQLTYHRDAEENVTLREYYGADDPDGDDVIDVPGADSSTGGFLQRIVRDAEMSPGRNSGQNPAIVQQTTRYEYTAQFGVLPNQRGTPTVVTDGRGIKDAFLVNALDQVVKEIRAVDVSGAPEPGLVAHAYERVTLYDANDNVVERRTQNKDGLDGVDDFIVHQFEYDILDQLTRETLDVGGLAIVNEYVYDESQNLIENTRGVGTPEEATSAWAYDERDILLSRTRGLGSPAESTWTTEIDENGNIVRWIDAVGPDARDFVFDGFDRLKTTIDRLEHVEILTYDSASNVIQTEKFGPLGPHVVESELSPSSSLLERKHFHFDERNRQFRLDQALFHYPGRSVGQLDDGALDPGDGLVSNVLLRDRNSRIVGLVRADDQLFERRYDGLSRLLHKLDPLGNRLTLAYDLNDNKVSRTETEVSPLIVQPEVFQSTNDFDSLDRLSASTEPNGQETRFLYDSRDNLIRVTDQLGNETEHRHDRLDRLVDTRVYLSANGENASATNNDPGQGGGDGVITKLQSWDALHRRVARTDDRGYVTTHVYDDLDRETVRIYADATFETWTYNADDELVTHTDQNGSISTWSHDADSRPVEVLVDHSNATAEVLGTTRQTWAYDGLDRVVRSTDDNGQNQDVSCHYFYDSLSRRLREYQAVASEPLLRVDTEWQAEGRKVSTTYPNGRRILRSYDDLDRQSEIREAADGSLIARFEYVGPERDVRVSYGNGTVLDKRNDQGTQTTFGLEAGYDSNRRHTWHRWVDDVGDPIITFHNTYNGPGGIGTNRRISELRTDIPSQPAGDDAYTFDSAYRMIGFGTAGETPSSRELDGVDKMLQYDDAGTLRNPVVDGDPGEAGMNQYSMFDGLGRMYTDNGNLEFDGVVKQTYVYDSKNRLVEVRDSLGDWIARYSYTSDNRRVFKNRSGTANRRYLYDEWQELEVRSGSNGLVRQFVDGRGIDEHIQLFNFTSGNTFYYHCNSQGFTGALTSPSADVREYETVDWLGAPRFFRPNGNEVTESPRSNPYVFQGRRYDDESGLYYFRNRYYDPSTGEFLTVDPLGNWHHGQGNGYSAFGEDNRHAGDPMGLYKVVFEDGKWKCICKDGSNGGLDDMDDTSNGDDVTAFKTHCGVVCILDGGGIALPAGNDIRLAGWANARAGFGSDAAVGSLSKFSAGMSSTCDAPRQVTGQSGPDRGVFVYGIRMLTANREATTKARNVATGTTTAQRNLNNDDGELP